MKKEHWLAGWSRIGESEFKALAGEAFKKDPTVRASLRQALISRSRESQVPGETVNRCLKWIDEISEE